MALFSSRFLLTTRALLYTYVSYLLVSSPKTALEYPAILILASSMNLPMIMVNEKSPIYGTIGIVLFSLVLCDLGPLIESNHSYFEIAVLLRLIFSFALCGYNYFGNTTNVVLRNSAIFAYAFSELWFGILTYSTLKEEKLNRMRDVVSQSEATKNKYERNELSQEDREEFEKKLEEDEYQKLMSEFK